MSVAALLVCLIAIFSLGLVAGFCVMVIRSSRKKSIDSTEFITTVNDRLFLAQHAAGSEYAGPNCEIRTEWSVDNVNWGRSPLEYTEPLIGETRERWKTLILAPYRRYSCGCGAISRSWIIPTMMKKTISNKRILTNE